MRRCWWIGAAALTVFAGLARADAVAEGQERAARAIAAQRAGEHAAAADLFGEALSLRPNHPGLTYRFAGASLRAGRIEAAIKALQDYAAMGLNADLAANQDFADLPRDSRFAALQAHFVENAKPRGSVVVVATIDEPQILAEGIARDPVTRRLFVASVHKRKVLAVDGGVVSDFVPAATGGLLGAFGLAIDESRRSLWVASSALPQVAGLARADRGRAGLFEFALADGTLRRKTLVAVDGEDHVLGDVVVSPAGEVFASDSASPHIYRLGPRDALEVFVRSDEFHSLQGLAFSPDGKQLAVADYSAGIHLVDVASRRHRVLAMPPRTTLHGIDGLIRHGRDLVGIQNGIDPQRVVLVRMTKAWSAVEDVEVLAANLPDMDEPTLATKDGDDLLIVGNGQWSRFADDGAVKGAEPFAATRIVRLRLPPSRH